MEKLSYMCYIIFFIGLVTAEYVPVIIWGPNIRHEAAIAMKSHNSDEFMNLLSKHLTASTTKFIVNEDMLSVEDLSQCKTSNGQTCFKGIKQIESKLYLPSVEDPVAKIEELAGCDFIEVGIPSDCNSSELLNYEIGKYIFVNFDDDTDDESKSTKLTRHDRFMANLYNEILLKNRKEIAIIFTGKTSSHHKRVPREASSMPWEDGITNTSAAVMEKINSGFVWKTEKLLLYYTSMSLVQRIVEVINVANETYTANTTIVRVVETEANITNVAVSHEDTTTLGVSIILADTRNDTHTFEFIVTTSNGYWWAHNFSWNNEPLFSSKLISAPDIFSYHCTPIIKLTTDNKALHVNFEGLQLQPSFDSVEGRLMESFGDAYDCVGFVNPVILSGLFVTFMLLSIVFIGILCMLDIKEINRFDNPKGKTITVTNDG